MISNLRDRPVQEIHAPVDIKKFISHLRKSNERTDYYNSFSLNQQKRLLKLYKPLFSFIKENYEISYKIAGAILDSQKNYVTKIKRLILEDNLLNERVELLGFVDNVPDLLDKADICIFTSLYEASPTSIWEAMAAGKPIVTTDVGSVSTYIKDGESGFIVPVNDHDQLLRKQ